MELSIVLAVVIIIGVALQVAVLFLLYRVINRLVERVERLLGSIEPEISDMGAGVRAFRTAVERTSDELAAILAGVKETTEELSGLARQETHELARVARRTTEVAERQVEALSDSLDLARSRIAEIGDGFDRTVLEPARALLAVASGVRRGVEALVAPRSNRSESLARRKPRPPADPWGDPADV